MKLHFLGKEIFMYVCMNCKKMANLIFQMNLDKDGESKIDLCPDCTKEIMKKKRLADKKK